MKLKLTKDPSHKGYYVDEEGNLYVFRFGGRPIRVDDYRTDKPNEHYTAEKLEVDKEEVIDHRKSASKQENEKFLEEAESEKSMREKMIKKLEGKEDYPTKNHKEHLERLQKDLEHEIDNTKERNDILEAVHNNEMNAMYYNMNELYDDLAGSLGVKTEEAKKLYNETYNEKETHYAGEELYSDDPNRFGDKMRKYNEKMNPTKNVENVREKETKYDFIIDKDIPDKPLTAEERKNRAQDELSRIREHDPEYNDDNKMSAREFIKKRTGQREMYQSIAKLMNDNEDKLSSEEWKALDNARMILKQNPELIADESPLLDESKPLHERLSKYMNDNEYKLDSGVWGPLYEANQELRKHDSGEITKLKDRYEKSQGVSDDWFTEEGRKLGMKDEDIADAIYVKKGAEGQGSSDANIKRIIAGKEKDKWEKRLKDYEEKISNPNTGDWDREFAKSELQGIKNKIEQYADYEAKFIRKVNRDDEPFIVKYSDTDSGFVENFKAKGLDEAFELQEQWSKYSPDVHIYDINGEEITYDKDRKHYTSPTYEENKKKELRNNFRSRLYGADRASLISMVHKLGLKWNVENFTDQQLYRMLQKELEK